MRNINKVILLGNVTRDPEMRAITASNQYITTFGLATNREWITKDGRKEQSAQFHDVVCFGRLAEIANQLLKKGTLAYIEGYLKTRSWDDATGVKKFKTEVVAEDLIKLEKRPKEEEMAVTEAVTEQESSSQATVTIEDPTTI